MKREVLLAIAAGVLLSSAGYAEYPEANLQYMGYGEDMTDVVDDEIIKQKALESARANGYKEESV